MNLHGKNAQNHTYIGLCEHRLFSGNFLAIHYFKVSSVNRNIQAMQNASSIKFQLNIKNNSAVIQIKKLH